jgi:hypothetical protein
MSPWPSAGLVPALRPNRFVMAPGPVRVLTPSVIPAWWGILIPPRAVSRSFHEHG